MKTHKPLALSRLEMVTFSLWAFFSALMLYADSTVGDKLNWSLYVVVPWFAYTILMYFLTRFSGAEALRGNEYEEWA